MTDLRLFVEWCTNNVRWFEDGRAHPEIYILVPLSGPVMAALAAASLGWF